MSGQRAPLKAPVLVLVGGFLGAGKTTLLLKAAELLRARGVRAAVIVNDQGAELVDLRLAGAAGLEAEQVTGGCFCCRFSDFLHAAERLLATSAEVIFAEPVGSCIDLAATVVEPLRRLSGERLCLAPFTVLVDPERAEELLGPEADPEMAYLFRNQLLEADLVCYTKADRCARFPELPGAAPHRLSGVTGEGVAAWLGAVLNAVPVRGGRFLDLDYGRYAEAEAALGWLDWQARLRLLKPLSPAHVVGPLLQALDAMLTAERIAIAHLKVFDQGSTGHIRASICRNGEEASVDGALDAAPCRGHELVLNLRARGAPETLRDILERAAAGLPGRIEGLHTAAFRPAPPKPEHRIAPG